MEWTTRKHRSKHSDYKKVLVIFILFIVFLLIFAQVKQSVFLSARERITVGVFAQKPYVFSYEVNSRLAKLVFFNPATFVRVPGGYEWYQLGRVNLLGEIEGKRAETIKKTFEFLIGAPVDIVIYPQEAQIVKYSAGSLLDFFLQHRQRELYAKTNKISTNNLIDRYFLRKILATRKDKLIVISAENDYLMQKQERYYNDEKLDDHLKGFFYQKIFFESTTRVVVHTDRERYQAGVLIARLIEGLGLKVVDIRIEEKLKKACLNRFLPVNQREGELLAHYFSCKKQTDNNTSDWLMHLYLDKSRAKMYL